METVEDYEHCTFGWKAFGHRLADGTRLDILLYYLSAKENFGHARIPSNLADHGRTVLIRRKTLRSRSDANRAAQRKRDPFPRPSRSLRPF